MIRESTRKAALRAGLMAIGAFIVIVLALLFGGCASAPVKYEGENEICFYARTLDFQNRKNEDQSKTVQPGWRCINALTYEYCKKQENFQECWDKIQ